MEVVRYLKMRHAWKLEYVKGQSRNGTLTMSLQKCLICNYVNIKEGKVQFGC